MKSHVVLPDVLKSVRKYGKEGAGVWSKIRCSPLSEPFCLVDAVTC